jgi:hypothetical protein
MCLDGKARVRRTTPPPESVVAGWYENASLLDSYSIDLSSSEQDSMRVLATRTVGDPPGWIKALVAMRDAMVTPFGVKTSGEVRASRADADRVDFSGAMRRQRRDRAGRGRSAPGLPVVAAPSPFSNRHAAHRDNRRALAQCLRPHLSQPDQAVSSPRGQDQPDARCTGTSGNMLKLEHRDQS